MLGGSSVIAASPMRRYECCQLAMRLKPTGDYPPFLALVNRFIERSFESRKTFPPTL